jgi:hypothetical protein
MNLTPTAPFSLVYLNAASFGPGLQSSWQALVQDPLLDPLHNPPLAPAPPQPNAPPQPPAPLLYVFVETGERRPPPVHGWTSYSQHGPKASSLNGIGGGGITLLYHSDCAVQVLTAHCDRIDPALIPGRPRSSAVVCAIVRPKHCAPFLLAVVYLPPANARSTEHLLRLTATIDAAMAAQPSLPLLVVGDFNCHHADWDCPMASQTPSSVTACANKLAEWIADTPLPICNPPGAITRHAFDDATRERAVIDLVLTSRPAMVTSVTQRHAIYLRTDHIPFTVELALTSTIPAPRPAATRPRVAWDHHRAADAWQSCLPPALQAALAPLQPALTAMAQPLPPGASAQATLDSVYDQLEQAVTATCISVVGTKVVRPTSSPWLSLPGVQETRRKKIAALIAVRNQPSNPAAWAKLKQARAQWRQVCKAAKRQCYAELCDQITARDSKLRWSLLKRAQPASAFAPLSSIVHPSTGSLPVSHAESLDHLCSAFIANGTPPPPSSQSAQSALEQQVASWASAANPTIPPHPSDAWFFTAAQVQGQCTQQHINTAPGPDALLPAFLRYAGPALWSALAAVYTFSWRHSVTPQAWREANVMALYKGAGDKSTAGSFRPISMTSILIRTFEHLIHRRLVKVLVKKKFFAPYQFGFRAGYSTTDAILFVLTSIQDTIRRQRAGDGIQCPVLFLDIKKAFDRVDNAILLDRVKAAGITGRAWLWLHSFLSNRRMRCVDACEHSAWQQVGFGVPQGCVLSPLLFLIFINDLQLTILGDPACSHVAPAFYADDGVLCPNPFDPHPPTATNFEAQYIPHLTVAMQHLTDWCAASRMQFGREKSQVVVFTLRKTIDTSPFASLQLCGFTVAVASSYLYLGLYLTTRLSWTEAFDHALKQSRRASALVIRVALAASTVSPAAIRLFVLSYILPSFSYGILFWGRAFDLSAAQATSLQAQLATPLRISLGLPRTTHQLGTLTLCQVPTVAAVAATAQLRHLARIADLPPMHPTRRLHEASVHRALTAYRTGPWTALVPSATLPLSVYLTACVAPHLLLDPALGGRLSPATRAALQLSPCPDYALGVQYWQHTGDERRKWAIANYSLGQLRAAITWSTQVLPNLNNSRAIKQIAGLLSHREWQSTHGPAAPALHRTTAPLTQCMPNPVMPSFLTTHSTDSVAQQQARSRLALGRARTGDVQLRFAKKAVVAATNPHCLQCSTPALPVVETIPHMLLHCLRHHAARVALTAALATIQCNALSLSTILGIHPPPHPFARRHLLTLLHVTSVFLSAIHADRAKAQLLPLDTG